MKSITFATVLALAGVATGYSQVPQRSLASIFRSNLAFYLPAPDSAPISTAVLNATGEAPAIAQNTWVEIKGTNLSQTTRLWAGTDFVNNQMPNQLDGVSATVNGKQAFVYYISPTQINILTPLDTAAGPVPVKVTTQFGTTAALTTTMQANSLGFFAINSGKYVVAQHSADFTLIGPPAVFPGLVTPAKPGEVIVLYGNGFGQVNPAIVNGSASQSGVLPVNPVITIGGIPAFVAYAAAISPGLYQFNVTVPTSVPDGDNTLLATFNGFTTQSGLVITIQH